MSKIFYLLDRLYTGPKDSAIFNLLATEPYKTVMSNNINMEESFNPTNISIQKVLNEPNTALFHFETSVAKYKCSVRLIYNRKNIEIGNMAT